MTSHAESAAQAGIQLCRFAEHRGISILYPENVRGLVPKDDFTVRTTEAAMHARAAGAKILAWAQHKDHSAAVVFEHHDGRVGYAQGTPRELLGPKLRELMAHEKAWSYGNMKRGGGGSSRPAGQRHGNYRRNVTGAKFLRASQHIILRLVRGHHLTEAYAEELVNRNEQLIEELISARLPTDYIARTIASAA